MSAGGRWCDYDKAYAEAGLIVPEFVDKVIGYRNEEEVNWIECPELGKAEVLRVPGRGPRPDPITESVLRWRWADPGEVVR